jgi:hypothetical protein
MKTKVNYELINTHEFSVKIKQFVRKNIYYPYEDIFQYLEVNIEFDHSTLKIGKINGIHDFSYRLMRSENDTLANWKSRENALYYIGEDVIEKAEKQVLKNVKQALKDLKQAKLNSVFLQLKSIADNKLEHFASDFNYHDCLNLYRYNPSKFIWMIRNSGTQIITNKNDWNKGLIDYQLKNHKNDLYWYEDGKINKISENELTYYYNLL